MAHVPPIPDTGAFDGPTQKLTFDGFLFDMDGTIIDSTDAIVKAWHKIAKDLDVDPNVILASSHGRRSIDTLALYDPHKANWAYVNEIESSIPREFGSDAIEVPGARDLLSSLDSLSAPWAIVTSGTKGLLAGWLQVMGLPRPEHVVVAEDVEKGKPDPGCYLLGREKVGLEGGKKRLLVLEDAPAGVRAGKGAGCTVLGLATTHEIGIVKGAGADFIVRDLRSVTARRAEGGGFEIELRDVWREKGDA